MPSSVDGVTTNPLTWNTLCTEFPELHFSLHTFVTLGDQRLCIQVPQSEPGRRWSIGDVDLLAQMYQPTPHELTDIVAPTTYDIKNWDEERIAVHRQFLVLQLAALRWRVSGVAADIWPAGSYRLLSRHAHMDSSETDYGRSVAILSKRSTWPTEWPSRPPDITFDQRATARVSFDWRLCFQYNYITHLKPDLKGAHQQLKFSCSCCSMCLVPTGSPYAASPALSSKKASRPLLA